MSYIYPDKCMFCGVPVGDGKVACKECFETIPYISGDTCERCGTEKEYCNCKVGDFAFKQNVSVFYFENSIKKMVYRFKFYKLPQIASVMADFMAKQVSVKYKDITFDLVTFVPVSPLKRVFRGYDQSKLLAKAVAERLGLPMEKTLSRKVFSRSQKYRKGKERRNNVRGKFKASQPLNAKRVLIIDDIMTTGSTLSECARVLKREGVKEVFCSTFAISCKK